MTVPVDYRDGSDNKTTQVGIAWAHPKEIKSPASRLLFTDYGGLRNLVMRLQLAGLNCRAIYFMTTQIDQLMAVTDWDHDFIAVEPRGV